jgi:hypothetical protein
MPGGGDECSGTGWKTGAAGAADATGAGRAATTSTKRTCAPALEAWMLLPVEWLHVSGRPGFIGACDIGIEADIGSASACVDAGVASACVWVEEHSGQLPDAIVAAEQVTGRHMEARSTASITGSTTTVLCALVLRI